MHTNSSLKFRFDTQTSEPSLCRTDVDESTLRYREPAQLFYVKQIKDIKIQSDCDAKRTIYQFGMHVYNSTGRL